MKNYTTSLVLSALLLMLVYSVTTQTTVLADDSTDFLTLGDTATSVNLPGMRERSFTRIAKFDQLGFAS